MLQTKKVFKGYSVRHHMIKLSKSQKYKYVAFSN